MPRPCSPHPTSPGSSKSVGPRFAEYVPLAVWEQIAGAAVSEVVFAVKQGRSGKPDEPGS